VVFLLVGLGFKMERRCDWYGSRSYCWWSYCNYFLYLLVAR